MSDQRAPSANLGRSALGRSAVRRSARAWPKGLPYIVVNEGCERFSFYGMKSILKVYLSALYLNAGMDQLSAQNRSTSDVHLFAMAVYATPLVGAVISDRLLGKYATIFWLSLVYCLGHAVLALFETSLTGVYWGLGLIAIGAGGIKPCVSAHLGDQFGTDQQNLLERAFQYFYVVINIGAFLATLLVPWTKARFGWSVAFGIPGVLMAVATWVFWLGRHRFVSVPPSPGGWLGGLDVIATAAAFMAALTWLLPWPLTVVARISLTAVLLGVAAWAYVARQARQRDHGFVSVVLSWCKVRLQALPRRRQLRALHAAHGAEAVRATGAVLRVLGIFAFVSIFWALWDQYATSWVDQAQSMDGEVDLGWLGSLSLLPEQIQALNPIMVLVLVPIFSRYIYPRLNRVGRLGEPLFRMALGMWLAALSFVVVAALQRYLDAGNALSLVWQALPYLVLTASEVLVSITGLEFAYTQAPPTMKSTIMSLWLLTTAVGNTLTAYVARAVNLPLFAFFCAFAGLMALAALLFTRLAGRYRYR